VQGFLCERFLADVDEFRGSEIRLVDEFVNIDGRFRFSFSETEFEEAGRCRASEVNAEGDAVKGVVIRHIVIGDFVVGVNHSFEFDALSERVDFVIIIVKVFGGFQ